MTYAELFAEIKGQLMEADVSDIQEHLAYQFNITGEASGIFYVEVKEGIYEIRDLQNAYFRHANYDPVEYFAYRGQKYPHPNGQTYEPMSLTYQPMTLQEKGIDKLGDIRYKTKWYPNGATTQAMYLTVMHRPEDNGLDFNFEHQVKAVSREELEDEFGVEIDQQEVTEVRTVQEALDYLRKLSEEQ